jgi:hypothetical protein
LLLPVFVDVDSCEKMATQKGLSLPLFSAKPIVNLSASGVEAGSHFFADD